MECILFLQKYDKLLKNSGRVKSKIDNVKIYYRKSEVQQKQNKKQAITWITQGFPGGSLMVNASGW